MNSLLEVHVRNSIIPDVVIFHNPKLGIRRNLFHQFGRRVDGVARKEIGNRWISLHRGSIHVGSRQGQPEAINIDRPSGNARLTCGTHMCGMGVDLGCDASEAEKGKRCFHLGEQY